MGSAEKMRNKLISFTSFPEHRFLFVMRHCIMDFCVKKLELNVRNINKGGVERLCDDMAVFPYSSHGFNGKRESLSSCSLSVPSTCRWI